MTNEFNQLEDLLKTRRITDGEYRWLYSELCRKKKMEAIALLAADTAGLMKRMEEAMPISEVWKTKEDELETMKSMLAGLMATCGGDRPY